MEDIEAQLRRSPDGATARRYMAAAKAAGRREEAVIFLSDLYRRTRDPGLWEAVRDLFTAPEIEGLAPPEEKTVGPEKEPLLDRRPYRQIVLSALKAPFATPSSIFILIVSGPLLLGAFLATTFMGCIGLGFAAFPFGYLVGFLFDVVEQAAQGRARGPRLLTLLWSDESRLVFVSHFLRWLAAVAATYWPIVFGGPYLPAPALAVASFLLTAWLPIAILQAVLGGGFSAFHYPQAFKRIRRLGADYWICTGLFLVTTLAVSGVQWAAYAWAGEHEERKLAALLFVSWTAFASWFVQMRAVGLLAWTRADVR